MGQINLDIGERSELRLKALAHQWGVPPGRVVDLLCESIDREALARLAIQALSGRWSGPRMGWRGCRRGRRRGRTAESSPNTRSTDAIERAGAVTQRALLFKGKEVKTYGTRMTARRVELSL